MLQMFLVLKSQSLEKIWGPVGCWIISLDCHWAPPASPVWYSFGASLESQFPLWSINNHLTVMTRWIIEHKMTSPSPKIWHLFSRRDTEAKTPTVVRDDQWTEWLMEGPTRETSEALTLVEGPLVEVEPVKLVWRLWEAERSGYPSDGGGVSSTVHVLVHLLGHLLCMAKVGAGHCHSAKHEQRDQNHHSNMLEGDSWSENWTSSALSHIF